MLKRIFKLLVVLLILGIIGILSLYIYAKTSPKLEIKSAGTIYIYDDDNKSIKNNNDWIKIDDINKNLINATISIEDKNFYNHHGFDILRIFKALLINIKAGENKQGASTISQQYAKNLFLDFTKTWKRKLDEALLTIRLEVNYSKDEILEGYLNTINYGGVFGIENASKYYFNKSSKDLTLAEATILAGIPKSPSNYSPINNLDNAKYRQSIILNSMVKNNYININDLNKAKKEQLDLIGKKNDKELSSYLYFEDAVLSELKSIKEIPPTILEKGGLKIYTTYDKNAQNSIENSINKNITNNNEIQVSSMVVDVKTGKIKGLIGGTNYNLSQYNRAISSKRQIGSTLKPFLYYSAIENGFTSSTTFRSSKTTFQLDNNKTYSPKNYGDIYANKDISLAAALAFSDNIYAVKTNLFLGPSSLVDISKRVKISSSFNELASLALGTEEVTLKNIMQGYQVLANSGKYNKLHTIKKIKDTNGNILYERKKDEIDVLNPSITYIISELLSNCYNAKFIDYTSPTCIGIKPKLSKKYAIKTGTTNTDHLVFGYNSDTLVGVWSGYDDNRKTKPIDGVNSKNIWADSIELYLRDKKNAWYKTPNNVNGTLVNPITGKISKDKEKGTILYYIKGTEPFNDSSFDSLIPSMKLE